MMNLMTRLWNDEAGVILSAELVLVATVLVVGMIVGLETTRTAVVQELADVGMAMGNISQSYSYGNITGHHSSTAGSARIDVTDDCDETGTTQPATIPGCLALGSTAESES